MSVFLKIIKNKQTKLLKVTSNLTINAEEDAQYQLVDEKGNAIEDVNVKFEGKDLQIVTEDNHASVNLKQYADYNPVLTSDLSQALTLQPSSITPTKSGSAISGSTLGYAGLGLLGIGGGLAAGGGGGGSSPAAEKTSLSDKSTTGTATPSETVASSPINTPTTAANLSTSNTAPTVSNSPATNNGATGTTENSSYSSTFATIEARNKELHTEAAKNAVNTVVITEMLQQQNDLSAHLTSSTIVRLTGKVNLDGVFGQYSNHQQLDDIRLTIGDKSYSAAVSKTDKTFFVDIPMNDLIQLQGESISYSSNARTLYDLTARTGNYQYKVSTVEPYTLTEKHIQFDSNAFISNHQVNSYIAENFTTIRGAVPTSAKAGDSVQITIGDSNYQTKVTSDLTFEISVPTQYLTENKSSAITATLISTDKNGFAWDASTQFSYSQEPQLSSVFVTTFDTANQDVAYFIEGIDAKKYQTGHLRHTPMGGSDDRTVTYSFTSDYDTVNKNVIKEIFDKVSGYSNIKFSEVSGSGEISFSMADLMSKSIYGQAVYGRWVQYDQSYKDGGLNSTFGFWLASHEIMHSLGAKHPHDPTVLIQAGVEDHKVLSVLSYEDSYYSQLLTRDFKLFDVAYLQYRFGVNPESRAENDTYTFKRYNPAASDGDIYIWDGNGIDTFDASQEKESVYVDLTPGSWIYRGQKTENFVSSGYEKANINDYFQQDSSVAIDGRNTFNAYQESYSEGQAFIGYGTQIERLIGSAYNDTLKGNVANNAIYGGAGNDLIDGNKGNDYLDGGLGADTLYGGLDNDIFVVDNAEDRVIEALNEGNDVVHSYIDRYQLTDHVENLTLFGAAKAGIGNTLANILIGNQLNNELNGMEGNDRLIGGIGKDTLTGGAGNDVFVFDVLDGNMDTITDFDIHADKIELSQSYFSSLNKSGDNLWDSIKYNRETGLLSYDNDNTDFISPIDFAQLTSNLELSQSHFVIA
ncbi:hypothetical protein [Glaesserella sp.]|uniref:hypothetical protein n=1 Tax=Glaesserella sp. TaxID=2094731 RepID=UPI00359FE98A